MNKYPHTRRQGFTLVELLVVAAVIVVLIGLLLPYLASAREIARRAKCAAQLQQFGVACATIAASDRGRMPRNYRAWGGNGIRSPRLYAISNPNPGEMIWNGQDPTNTARYGTPWSKFLGVGLTEQLMACPSMKSYTWEPRTWFQGTFWGRLLQIQYAFVSGLEDSPGPLGGWNVVNPASRRRPQPIGAGRGRTDQYVIAADLVWWGGGGGYAWNTAQAVNHVDQGFEPANPGDPPLPAFQNILAGDGHVEGEHGWDNPLENYASDPGNWSVMRNIANGQFYFWDGTEDK